MDIDGYNVAGTGSLEIKTIYRDTVQYSLYVRLRPSMRESHGTGVLTGPAHYKAARMCDTVVLILENGHPLNIRVTGIRDSETPSADFEIAGLYPDLRRVRQA